MTSRTNVYAWWSIAVALAVLGLKLAAWAVTGGAALFSDATENTVNVATAMMTVATLVWAARPADAGHNYGHGKAEFFAAVIEGVLIVVAALLIVRHAWEVWRHPVALERPGIGLMLTAVAGTANGLWARLLIRSGTRLRSPALVADGKHVLSDVVTSAGVFMGVGLVVVTGLQWLDPLVGALAALMVLASGFHLIGESVGGLLDAAPAEGELARIRGVLAAILEDEAGVARSDVFEVHDLRVRRAGRNSFMEFHLVVPGAMSVAAAHRICDRMEAALREAMPELRVTIHVEPEEKAKHGGVAVS
jgi:cation diffusion facilitator family transporter